VGALRSAVCLQTHTAGHVRSVRATSFPYALDGDRRAGSSPQRYGWSSEWWRLHTAVYAICVACITQAIGDYVCQRGNAKRRLELSLTAHW